VTPPGLGPRGRRLWRELTADEQPSLIPTERVLLEEACRLADRLDTLDRMLRGDEDAWMRLRSMDDDGSIVQVVINNLLSEARQQQVALKQLLGELRQSRTAAAARLGPPKRPGVAAGGMSTGGASVPDGVADLTARIASRSPQAAG
jgi:hypothetical protein